MRKLLIAILGLFLIAVGGLLVAPNFVDWNEHKGRVTAELSKVAGRTIQIDGDLSLRLLPTPTLSATGVRLANIAGGEATEMVSLEAVEVRVALAPLLEGRIAVDSVVLVEPEIVLERLADERVNWQFETGAAGRGVSVAEALGGLPFTVELNDVRIQNGAATYRDTVSGTTERVDGINAVVAAASLSGPFHAKGELNARGRSLEAEVGLGRLVEDKGISLSLALVTAAGAGRIEFSGFLSGYPNAVRARGNLKASSHDLATTVAGLTGTAANPYLARPLELDGAVVASAEAIAVNDISFRLGSITGTGAADMALEAVPRANLVLNIGQIDMDTLRAAAAAGAPAAVGDRRAGISGFALPLDLAASFEIKADAVVHNGGVVRQVKLAGELAVGELIVNQAGALLPGGSSVSLFGSVAARDGAPVFEGQVESASDNLRGLLQWLDVDIEGVPRGRLRKLVAQAAVKASPSEITLTDLDVQVDVSRVRGGVAVALRDRPGLGIGLVLDKLDIDAYMPTQSNGDARASGSVSLRERLEALAGLDKFDAILDLTAGTLNVGGIAMQKVRIDGTLRDAALELREASISNISGAAVSVAGRLDGFGDTPSLDVKLTLDADDPAPLLRLAEIEPPVFAGIVSLEARLKGNLDRMSVDAELDALGGRLEVGGDVALLDSEPEYDIAVFARHGSLAGLSAALVGSDGDLSPDVPLSLEGTVRGKQSEATVDLTLSMDDGTVAFDGTVANFISAPTASLTVAAAYPDLAGLMQIFDPGFTPTIQGVGAVKLDGNLAIGPDRVTLSDLQGALGPTSIEGEAELDRTRLRPRLDARFATGDLVLDWFLAAVAPTKEGERQAGRWSRQPVDLTMLSAADLRLQLSAPSIAYGPYRVERPEAELEVTDGVLNLRRLVGRAYEGDIALTARLAAGDVAQAELKLEVDGADAAGLTGASQSGGTNGMIGGVLELLFPVAGVEIMSGKVDAEISVTASGRNEFELIAGLGGEASVDFTDAVITGVDLCRVSKQLDELDGIEGFLGLFDATSQGGETRVGDFAGRFAIKDGVASLDQQRLAPDCATIDLSGTVNLPRWLMSTEARAKLTDHEEFPGLVVEQSGPIDQPNTRLVNLNDIQGYILGKVAQRQLEKTVPQLVPMLAPQLAVPQTQPPPASPPPDVVPQPKLEAQPQPEALPPEPEALPQAKALPEADPLPQVEGPPRLLPKPKVKPALAEPAPPDPAKIFQGILEGLIGP